MSDSADSILQQVRDFHLALHERYGTAAVTADDARVAMLLDYISDGHRQLGDMLERTLGSVSPDVLAECCAFEFDAAAALAVVDGQLAPAIGFDQLLGLALQTNRGLHAALEAAADTHTDRRVQAVLRLFLQRSREVRNRLVMNATLLRDF
jgi:hypothetical protein